MVSSVALIQQLAALIAATCLVTWLSAATTSAAKLQHQYNLEQKSSNLTTAFSYAGSIKEEFVFDNDHDDVMTSQKHATYAMPPANFQPIIYGDHEGMRNKIDFTAGDSTTGDRLDDSDHPKLWFSESPLTRFSSSNQRGEQREPRHNSSLIADNQEGEEEVDPPLMFISSLDEGSSHLPNTTNEGRQKSWDGWYDFDADLDMS